MSSTPSTRPLRIGIVAGEMSGDILGAGLMAAIQKRYPDAIFEGVGGEKMLALGFSSFFPMDRLSVMGLIEPLKRLPELLNIRRFLKKHFLENPPDIFIGIDSPDFNLNLELFLRKREIKTVHYVSPSVWAWRQGRVKKIRQAVDHVLCLLPFETEFYEKHAVPATFVGHPLADKFSDTPATNIARTQLGLDEAALVIAVMPGSRSGEVKLLGPVFLEVIEKLHQHYPKAQFVIPAANRERKEQIQALLREVPDTLPVMLFDGKSHEAMEASDVVLLASGTTALEAMLLKKPMVVAYKMAPLSYKILAPLIKAPFVSLPNLLAGKALVPELLQDHATVGGITKAVCHWVEQKPSCDQLVAEFQGLHLQLKKDASEAAASEVLALIQSKNQKTEGNNEYGSCH